ncbi:ABC transporter permease [Roseomonas sp. AR75]|uniref:ABC transporter permease n=1 Tax=Roseomonas sp. AR75 TaxID=2562311 RepID=UPI0010C023F6|nr:ABC transporter permease [Roseomonas sp. AR75]
MDVLRRFLRSLPAATGLAIVLVALAAAILGPAISPHDPDAQDIMSRLLPPLSQGEEGAHWLGTDALGRDILSRLIVGARVSMLVGVSAMVVSALVGVSAGLAAGYDDRGVGRALMAVADVQLAIPFLVLALAVVAVLGPSLLNLILVLGVANWVQYARVVRAECLVLRNLDFVLAAQAAGTRPIRIVTRHLLPNVMSSVTVISGLLVAKMILFESSLSFLGLGVPPSIPTWGAMIADGRNYVANAWWVAAMPGFALFLTVIGINLVGDRLRDMLDPRLSQVEN